MRLVHIQLVLGWRRWHSENTLRAEQESVDEICRIVSGCGALYVFELRMREGVLFFQPFEDRLGKESDDTGTFAPSAQELSDGADMI